MTCYKCGKELPPGDTSGECEGGCVTEEKALCLTIEIFMDRDKVYADPERQRAAALRFSFLLGTILHQSGLTEFIKRLP